MVHYRVRVPTMRLQFTLRRLLLANLAFAAVLAVFRGLDVLVDFPALGVCCGLAAFAAVLMVQKEHLPRVAMETMCSVAGAFLATPVVCRPGSTPGTALACSVAGAVIGWVIGCGLARWDERLAMQREEPDRPPTMEKTGAQPSDHERQYRASE